MQDKKRLVLFDFDGTITTRDTFIEFLIFYKGLPRFIAGMIVLLPTLAMFAARMIPNWKAKEAVLQHFLCGEDLGRFNSRCQDFCRDVLPDLIRPEALEAIARYKDPHTIVAVVSASAENWIQPWCNQYGLLCIATQLDVVSNKITGNLCGKNCYGPEKVKRIEKEFSLDNFHEVIAYGDSVGDREMLKMAHTTYYKPFRTNKAVMHHKASQHTSQASTT